MFAVRIAQLALDQLGRLRAYDRNRAPSFDHVLPVWQLRVAEFRVIYDVDEEDGTVIVRAALRKGRRMTGDIL